MPATHSITTDLLNTLRSGGFAGELRFAVCPNDVIWQATVNETITSGAFIEFDWDNSLAGSRADVVVGMTFMITATDDPVELRAPLLRGRVSRTPTSTTFYCNESGINLQDGYIVTVLSTFEILQKDRIGALVDGFEAYTPPAPIVKNMQAFYYGEDDTGFQFSFSPVGQAMAQGATITGYTWTLPSGTVYNTGSSSTQAVTVTVPSGHHWCYLTVADSNGTTLRFIFEILVCERDDPAYMFVAHDDVTINGSIEAGWSVTTTFFAGVETLLNRTRCALVAFDVPKSGDASLFNNVIFVGYIVQETTAVTADPLSSLLSQTNIELQSFTAIAAQLPVPSLAIRNVAAPTAWEEITLPTTQRVVAHLMTRYSTLANLCAIDMLYTDSTWFGGEMDLEAGTLIDSINKIADEINARLVFFPQGDATLEINGNFLSDAGRSALPTLITSGNLEPQDLFGYSLPVPYYKTVGQVKAGVATFYTSGAPAFKVTALAPSTSRQEGNEQPVILAQLLAANLTQSAALAAARQRIGNLLEYLNPPTTLPTTYKDSWRLITPSTRVWLTYDLPAADSTRGLPVAPTSRWWLQSVQMTWRVQNGVWEVQGTPRLETRGGLAQTAANISPNTIDTSLPELPAMGDYDAFAPDSSLNYGSIAPDARDRQPFDPFDMAPYNPMTTESAANAADNTPTGDCQVIRPALNFKSAATRATSKVTVNGQIYTVTVKGSARLSVGGWVYSQDFENDGLGEWVVSNGTYTPGTGVVSTGSGGNPYTADVMIEPPGGWGASVLESWTIVGSSTTADAAAFRGMYYPDESSFQDLGGGETGDYTLGAAAAEATPAEIHAQLSNTLAVPGSNVIKRVILRGSGDNPFTGAPGGEIRGDAFYQWVGEEAAELYPAGYGLLVNGTPVAVPPLYNENHEYVFLVAGDGNVIPFTYYDTGYSDNQNLPLYVAVCGPGMGT